jgi:Xaa-Pro dipeptidase
MDALASLYPAHLTTVKERHDRALTATGFDHAVIFSGALKMQFLDDQFYPFKASPHFKSWVPVVDNPNCVLIYTPGRKPVLVYHQPIDYWYKPAETPTGYWVDEFDIRIIREPEQAKEHLPKSGRTAFIGEPHALHGADVNPDELMSRLHWERSWKTGYELACIRGANEIGTRAHRVAAAAFQRGRSEFEIHIDYLLASLHTEHELPYDNIIAVNEHASVLHYINHERHHMEEEHRHSFLIDAGASMNGYASDITRTYSRQQDEFADLIVAFDRMQQDLCEMVKPGVNYIDIHMAAHQGVAQLLHDFRFVDADPAGIVEKRISSTFFPHGVGHFVGLQVHDVAGFHADCIGNLIAKPEGHEFLRLTRVIEKDMSFTIEPGLYFIDVLLKDLKASENAKYVNWSRVEAFRKFGGIRVEDDVVVTDDGHVNLTREAFAQTETPGVRQSGPTNVAAMPRSAVG